MSGEKLTKAENKEPVNTTAGRILGRAKLLGDTRLILLAEKLCSDLKRLGVI